MAQSLRVTELDFDQLKTNLKNFLRGQSEFSDYDFDGSALSVLIDNLAYNSHYLAVLAHLLANEQFLDTATKRSSVVSLAKMLGYTPRSAISARATVTITVTPTGSETSLSLPTTTKFTAAVNGQTFSFYPQQEYVASLDGGTFVFEDVVLIEGTPITNSFTVASDTLSGPFRLPAPTIDLSTLQVTVQASVSQLSFASFTRETTIVDVQGTDAVFWVEESTDERYQVVFGDDVIGQALVAGNVVLARYQVSSGPLANGARLFTLQGSIGGETAIEIDLVTAASSGSVQESIDSVRFNAPKFNSTRNRAVTAQDYKSLILAGFDKAKSVSVWGGEQNTPPIFGSVFITIDPKDDAVITDGDKDFILNTILRPRSVMTVRHVFVDPEYLYLGFEIDILFNPNISSLSATELSTAINQQIQTFFTQDLTTLDQTFFYSQFVDRVQQTDSSVVSVLVKMRLQKRLVLETAIVNHAATTFLTSLVPSSVRSTNFVTTVNGQVSTVYIQDYPTGATPNDATDGVLKLQDAVTRTPVGLAGTVNYLSGEVVIDGVNVTEYLAGATDIRLTAQPTDLGLNISPRVISTTAVSEFAVAPTPSKNVVVALDNSQADPTLGLRNGLVVTVAPYIEIIR